MGMVAKRIHVRGNKGSALVRALFDTGASSSLIRRDIAVKITSVLRARRPWIFQLGDGKSRLKSHEMVAILFSLKGISIFHPFVVAPALADELIIGTDLMQRWKIRVDPAREDVVIDKKLIQFKLV